MATLKVEHPEFEDGYEFRIDGIGTVANGESYEISDEQAAAVEHANGGLSLAQMFKDNPYFVLSGKGSHSTTDEDDRLVGLRVGNVVQDGPVVSVDNVDEEEQDEAQAADDTPSEGEEGQN